MEKDNVENGTEGNDCFPLLSTGERNQRAVSSSGLPSARETRTELEWDQ